MKKTDNKEDLKSVRESNRKKKYLIFQVLDEKSNKYMYDNSQMMTLQKK